MSLVVRRERESYGLHEKVNTQQGKAILVILQREQINTKVTYSGRLDKTVDEPAVYFC